MRQSTAPPATATSTSRSETTWLLITAAVVLLIGVLLPLGPDRVDVTIQNPTDYLLYVSASTPVDDTLTPVAIVSPRTTLDVSDVIDRGDAWVLHVRSPGSDAGVLTVERASLLGGDYTIPTIIGDELAAAGVVSDVELDQNRGR
ncbi:MAG: hypothetical protein WBP59_05145 [Ilumatobacteraceae bacterium]